MTAKQVLNNLLKYYNLRNMKELAEKLDVSQSVVSNWKARSAIGAIVERVSEVDVEALSYIFNESTETNNFQNSNNLVAQNFGNKNKITSSEQSEFCKQINTMDKTIVQSFISVYQDLEKKNDLKKLYTILGELKWS